MERINNSTSACASCKHQRKKCTDKCILAPFFPINKTREFQAVHKVFGVSNVTKIITNLREEDQKRAVDSLVWEAVCRQKDPVLGPYAEYRRICEELRLYKSQFQQQLHQLPISQGSLVYKPTAQGLMGWNNNKVMNTINGGMNQNNNNNNNIHTNGNSIMDFWPYGYNKNSAHNNIQKDPDKTVRTVRDKDSSTLILPQNHFSNGFNQSQYFLTGHQLYNTVDSKSMESTIWEGSS